MKEKDLVEAKIVGISLHTPGDNSPSPIHEIEIGEDGRVISQKNTPNWGEKYLTFPPAFKNVSEIAEWSCNPLPDCYGYGDTIEQRVCIIEEY